MKEKQEPPTRKVHNGIEKPTLKLSGLGGDHHGLEEQPVFPPQRCWEGKGQRWDGAAMEHVQNADMSAALVNRRGGKGIVPFLCLSEYKQAVHHRSCHLTPAKAEGN